MTTIPTTSAPATTGRLRAVLFDCDGVLVDSESSLARIAAIALRDFGIPAEPEDFAPFIGMGEDAYIGGVARKHGSEFSLEMKHHIYEKYVELCETYVPPMPGAVELIRALRGGGFRVAMATSADRVKAAANLRVLGIDESAFDAVVTGDDVERKKPFPDIYLAAAARCGVAPGDAWVVEDAESGVQAAKAAGMHAIALTSSFPAGRLLAAGADDVIDRLDQVPALVGLDMDRLNGIRKVGLRDPSRLLLDGVHHGGDQEWYADEWHRRAGCGPTTAATLSYYLAQRDETLRPLWPTASIRNREDFIRLMDRIWTFVTPGMGGLNRACMFTTGMERFAADCSVPLTAHVLEIPESLFPRKGFAHFLSFLRRGLEADCPVAFLNLSNGRTERLHSWHWITIVAAEWDDENTDSCLVATVCDEAATFDIDLKCWYDTSLLGGALVWFS